MWLQIFTNVDLMHVGVYIVNALYNRGTYVELQLSCV